VADERALATARDLEGRDERLVAALAEIGEVERAVAALRDRAVGIGALLQSAPDHLAAAAAAVAEAEHDLAGRREQAVEAERELVEADRGRDEQRRAAAARAVERTRDAVVTAERRVGRAVDARAALERAIHDAGAEVPALEAQAGELTARLRGVPRISQSGLGAPQPGLGGLDEWGSRVAAALFVVRSGFEGERDRLIREAQELASSVLGEHIAATSVSLARARIERNRAS
jgi:chromosome segregation ATPase